ncbi:ferrated catecholamine ABC transporter substrate-binding lipoprotein SstD [Staphylococcus gallinarum]|uniref:ferrated catecholamine ABC transporter substrate-binding lipoprotein SstD n=1 Tax=Staphylococcus gallinarum TaxID=1293 RepID=UPI001E4792F8|nr:siderophore ABC transporter substrate-binding protein [Staphylococcus gallinarum]MCD8830225.1 siderophore ABC transporter substrate-binding protein [Staphylococcus gallinarum]MEB6054353.1 siderophore ABC transporter substrate-binding protein [Staphylococcus gallinarum]
MKKYALVLVIGLMFLLAACGNSGSGSDDKKSESKDTKDTVKIENNYKASGEKRDGSDAKTVKETVEVPKNPKKAVVFDYGTLDTMKELGLADKVKAVPKGEGGKSLPDFLSDFKDEKYLNTGSLKEVNYDKVAAAKPDVIYISGRTANQKNLDEFKKAAPDAKVVYVGVDNKNEVNSLKENAEKLGKIYDKESEVKSLNKKLDDKIAEVKDKTKDMKDEKAMFLLVNEGELSTYGAGDRFGSLIFNTMGFTAADDNIKGSTHGQNVTNEYIAEKNPAIIFAMDRGQAIGGKSTAKQALDNDVIKNVDAVKHNKVYELDPKLWYFASGSTTTAIKQMDEVEKALDKK